MDKDQVTIREAVREYYADKIKTRSSCCGSESQLYSADLLATLPPGESNLSYGCGDPVTLASLQPGQTVLDLGSGAGLDCFFAAKKVGSSGRVIGVDMTPEMIDKARASAQRLNFTNVEFRHGYLEQLPVEDSSVDVILSNCVINLSPDKSMVFKEAYRVLRPGGRLAVSDIVTDGPLPEAIKRSLSAWAGCVSGAVEAEEYIEMMKSAGFKEIEVKPVYFDKDTVDSALAELDPQMDLSVIRREEIYQSVYSAKISARKPAV
jgi:ubiquinone/menaquinone biosynthesis C-methylase UbiE